MGSQLIYLPSLNTLSTLVPSRRGFHHALVPVSLLKVRYISGEVLLTAILQRLPFSSAYHSPATTVLQRLPFSSAYHSQRLELAAPHEPPSLVRVSAEDFTECSIDIHSHITIKMSASRRATATTWPPACRQHHAMTASAAWRQGSAA